MKWLGDCIQDIVREYDGISTINSRAVLLTAHNYDHAHAQLRAWHKLCEALSELEHLSGHEHCNDNCKCPLELREQKTAIRLAMALIDKGNPVLHKPVNAESFRKEIASRRAGNSPKTAQALSLEDMQADVDLDDAGGVSHKYEFTNWE